MEKPEVPKRIQPITRHRQTHDAGQLDVEKPVGPKEPFDGPHHCPRVGYVLQNMAENDNIEGSLRQQCFSTAFDQVEAALAAEAHCFNVVVAADSFMSPLLEI